MPDVTEQVASAFADQYIVEREVGRGGMATVYLATDRKHERPVALKVLHPELAAILGEERFLAEIRITARLDHPHILTLIDSGEKRGLLFYVLPFVQGESLRARLDREPQLPLSDAVAIVRQVASALDYAHRQGIIHRDIKPENILLHEGEAMLTDFGIALAVSQAAGNRLTETGLSLGTPEYMSPEQATGDRHLDQRTDVYALGAVCYEMLAGEPPVTGATAQAVIAKLLTERPTPLTVVRDGLPEYASTAVARALAKTPADRFRSAGDFANALDAGATGSAPSYGRRRPIMARLAIAAFVAASVALAVLGVRQRRAQSPGRPVLGERIQLTSSANVLDPVISPDGKQLAYFAKRCDEHHCTYAVAVQDVGSAAAHVILDGATDWYGMEWSPDRRNLIIGCALAGRIGAWLVPVLGGAPRFVGSAPATFTAGGDSLLVASPARPDSVFWIWSTTLAGLVTDSLRVSGASLGVKFVESIPGTRWIVVGVDRAAGPLLELLDRRGHVADRVAPPSPDTYAFVAGGALWLTTAAHAIVHIPIDATHGRFTERRDTIPGPFNTFSVTADGSSLVMDQGTYEWSVWRLPLADLFAGRLPDSARIAQSSTPLNVRLSPDGARLLWIRQQSASGGNVQVTQLGVTAMSGGPETAINVDGTFRAAKWEDSGLLAIASRGPQGEVHDMFVDGRSGRLLSRFDFPADSGGWDFTALSDGMAWIPASADRILVSQRNHLREFRKPAWFSGLLWLESDHLGPRISYAGPHAAFGDSVGFGVISLADGSSTQWGATTGLDARTSFLPDHSVLLVVFDTRRTIRLYRSRKPGDLKLLGTISLPWWDVDIAEDLRHAILTVRDYHSDAWMTRIRLQ